MTIEPKMRKSHSERVRSQLADLELDLNAAYRTIDVLLDRLERGGGQGHGTESPTALFEFAARLELENEARVREVDQKRQQLEAANLELRTLTSNLDQIVRLRTRALAESEEQLRAKNAELQAESDRKLEFLAIAAHELRTPLTSIAGYLGMCTEGKFGDMPAPFTRPLAAMLRNTQRLQRLLDDMLDVSLIGSRRMQLARAPVNLGVLLGEVLVEMAPLLKAKRQQCETDLPDQPAIVNGDSDKLFRVMINILTNASRYSPEDSVVTAKVFRREDSEIGPCVVFTVRNVGVGITSEQKKRLFQPLSGSSPIQHHSSGPGSAGLGFYITRGIVELHGGGITIDSEINKHTDVAVMLPA